MTTITVNASRTYEVKIAPGLLARAGELSAPLIKGRDVVVVSDSNVWPIYGRTVQTSLEQAGFRVETAVLFDRPTKQASEDGLADWIRMFLKAPFAGMAGEEKEAIIRETVEDLRPVLYRDGSWIVDYVRLRFRARIPEKPEFGK